MCLLIKTKLLQSQIIISLRKLINSPNGYYIYIALCLILDNSRLLAVTMAQALQYNNDNAELLGDDPQNIVFWLINLMPNAIKVPSFRSWSMSNISKTSFNSNEFALKLANCICALQNDGYF